jgi:hypothetical protein
MQAVILVTHIETGQIYKHFLRLKAECRDHLDAYLCVHMSADRRAEPGHEAQVDFRLSASDEEACLPARHAEKIARGGTIVPGFCDLTYMPALLSPRLANYTHVWIVEYDVDYAGPWDRFFGPLAGSEADLIGTTFYPRQQSLDWMWWPIFEAPPAVSRASHTRSFVPIARFSRRMILQYEKAVRGGEWRGHVEALYPTIARHLGLTIEDLGGDGPFTPRSLVGRNYSNTPSSALLRPGTFTTPPANHAAYFHEAPEIFPVPGYLYHPVKVHGAAGQD